MGEQDVQVVVDVREVDATQVAQVGGKAAGLGALSRIEGTGVPPGCCVTTGAFRRAMASVPSFDERLDRLARLHPGDRTAVSALSAELREAVEAVAVPDDVASAVRREIARLGEHLAWAVRSSATAEDLPTASFAGQHDSYLDVRGAEAVLGAVRRCWASLFTERAVTYRLQGGIDHRAVDMAVVVQQLVPADASGVLFTAEPVTGERSVATVEAVAGLGEDLVSGRVDPDVYRVRDGAVVAEARDRPRGEQPPLSEEQVLRLVALGRRVEAASGRPQDVEWCLAGETFHLVQSRPITTLFPVPEVDDDAHHVYLSVAHQQMMTDPMKPLGISVWQLTAMAPMLEAGGRLWVDATPRLASPAGRAALLDLVGRGDPLVRDALETVVERGFVPTVPDAGPARPVVVDRPEPLATDPAVVTELVRRTESSLAALERDIAAKRGPELFEFLLEAFAEHKRVVADPLSLQAIMAGMEATWWLNDHLLEWLGEKNAADALTLSAPGNITSEMGLALLDVADVVRPYPEVVALLERVDHDGFLDELPSVAGGAEARRAIEDYLDRYGMRCVGEIDITRPRWRERPSTLVPLLLDHVRDAEPGEAARRFEQGRQRAERAEREILDRLRALPDGEAKAAETQRMVERVRTFVGYREYPKYGIISRFFAYKQALVAEARRLVDAGVLTDAEDVFFLTFQEFRDAVRSRRVDAELVERRRAASRSYELLTPPRVLTSDGEAISGSYRRDDVPAGALVGLAVSAGTVEGRARVVRDMSQAAVQPGDVLVTTHTDPSWTPLFVSVAGLVTEVGGLMTHGAVIAREYGLPAVVGVEGATRLIRDGQRIRVHGSDGYVELLPQEDA